MSDCAFLARFDLKTNLGFSFDAEGPENPVVVLILEADEDLASLIIGLSYNGGLEPVGLLGQIVGIFD